KAQQPPAADVVIIDEAENWPPGLYRLWKLVYPQAAWTLVGDLDQRRQAHPGLNAWREAQDALQTATNVIALKTAYR
ncbi:hypothetical protein, partial [Methylacidiphilum caldifontis]|uniref:hypothetical protein n=1 Tax=Methylacidiphilum caldifontis TaxID=2795386 RepID=UPI001ABBFF17